MVGDIFARFLQLDQVVDQIVAGVEPLGWDPAAVAADEVVIRVEAAGFNYKDANGEPTNELPLSTLTNVVRDCAGVRKLDDSTSGFLVNLKHQDLAIGVRALPRLGQITLINGDTGATM